MTKLLPQLSKFDHIIWDWNGTLLYDLPHAVNTVNGLLSTRKLPLLDEQKYKAEFRFPIRDYYTSIGFDLEQESFEELCNEFVDAYMASVFNCSLVDGAYDLLTDIKKLGKTQSVLSATDQENLDKMMTHFSLRPLLDHIFGIENKLAASKVHRGHELLQLSRSQKNKTVLIGDTDHDLEVAHALGIEAILVAHGHQNEEKLRSLHPHVVNLQRN